MKTQSFLWLLFVVSGAAAFVMIFIGISMGIVPIRLFGANMLSVALLLLVAAVLSAKETR